MEPTPETFLPPELSAQLQGRSIVADKTEMIALLKQSARLAKKIGDDSEQALRSIENDRSTDAMPRLLAAFASDFFAYARTANRIINRLDNCSRLSASDLATALYTSGQDPDTSREWGELLGSIKVSKSETAVLVYTPIIPARKAREHHFMDDLLLTALAQNMPYPKWPRVHIAFTHVFPTSISRMPKDADNYNYKPTIDRIAKVMRFSDGAATCSLSMRTEFRDGYQEGCYICITPDTFANFSEMFGIYPFLKNASSEE